MTLFQANIDVAGSDDLLPILQKDLALLAASLDSRFLQAGMTLATVIEATDRVITALDGVTSALDEDAAVAAVSDLGLVAGRLAALPEAQAVRQAELTTVSAMAVTLRRRVMEMHQALHVLRIYGVNIKIAASGADEFVGFVNGMTVTLGVGEQELDAFLLTLKELGASVASAQQAERLLAAECGKVVPAVPRRLAGDASELQAHLATVADAAQRVSAIARDIQGRVAIVLGALQVGDSTRQRLEHVVSALQMLDARPATDREEEATGRAVAAHVYRLLSAQLEAIGADFEREALLLVSSLKALGPDTSRLLAVIENETGENGRAFLHRLERGITEVERLTTQLHDADHRSHAMVATIAAALHTLSVRQQSIKRIRLDVQDIAVNTRLMCRRFGNIGKAVSVIASEVDVYANRLGSALDGVMGPIGELSQVSLSMRQAETAGDGLDAGQALSMALRVIRDGCQRTEQGVSKGRDDAQQVIMMIAQTGDELACELALGNEMKMAGANLLAAAGVEAPLPDAADPPLRILLAAIANLYTMAQERAVHSAFLLPGMASVTTAPPSDDGLSDDDDDGLF